MSRGQILFVLQDYVTKFVIINPTVAVDIRLLRHQLQHPTRHRNVAAATSFDVCESRLIPPRHLQLTLLLFLRVIRRQSGQQIFETRKWDSQPSRGATFAAAFPTVIIFENRFPYPV